jgi:hypothetical protein
MSDLINCQACGEQNPTTSKFCRSCGIKLEIASASVEQTSDIADSQPQWSASQMAVSSPKTKPPTVREGTSRSKGDQQQSGNKLSDYAALRSIAALCRTLSWIAIGLAALQAIGGLVVMSDSFLAGLAVIMAAAIGGGLLYILLQVIAESISVILDIEANTRRAASVLEQRLNT